MNITSCSSITLRRFCSTIISANHFFSEEELQAVLELKRKSEQTWSKTADTVLKSRCWARAPVLEVSGRKPTENWFKVSKKGSRFSTEEQVDQAVVKLRWANLDDRDVDILLSPEETIYKVEVKAVLYGIIQAIDLKETKVRMKSVNDIVVKVANKQYNASKETASFHLIHHVVNGSDAKNTENQMKAKLEKVTELDKPIRRIASTTMTENEFFHKYRNSINILKSYS